MPRRKAVEAELFSPEDDQLSRGRKKLVEAEHTIKYSAPVTVPVEEDPAEDPPGEDFDFVEEEKAKKRRKTSKDERDDLRRELDKLGVASVSRLKLSIDKYRHSDSDDSGTLAAKDYCTKYPVTKDDIINDDYMDVARRYGAGRYWFTLRMDNKIVRQWERQVNQAVTPAGPVIQHVNPNDPTSPPVVFQLPEGAQQPVGIVDPMKQMRELAKTYRELKQAFEPGAAQATTATAPPTDPEVVLLQNLANNDKFMDKINNGLLGKVLGKGALEDDPSWSAVGMEAVKSGQLGPAIDGIGRILFGIVERILPARGNNGQTPLGAQTVLPVANTQGANPQESRPEIHALSEGQRTSAIQEGMGNVQGSENQRAMTSEEQALNLLVDHCQRNAPVKIAFDRLMAYADMLNDQAPQYSIDGYLDLFGAMETDQVIEFVKTIPGGEQVVSLPHAKEWTASLQQMIKEAGSEGDQE